MDNWRRNLVVHNNGKTKELLAQARSKEIEVCVWGAGAIGTGFGKQILEKHGVHIDYYCDNGPGMENVEVIPGVYCRSIDKLIKNKERTVCFILVGYAGVGMIYKQLIESGIKNIVTYDDLLALPSTMKGELPFLSRKDTAVYTCITGGYDDVREPRYISDRCDYFLITDKAPDGDSAYQWLDIKNYLPEGIEDPIYQNRYCKINAHKIFPQYRYSVYVDGNITIVGDLAENINKLKKARLGVLGENYTDNIYEYALRCAKMGADWSEKLMWQMESYWLQGLPEDSGSFACGILVREHNNPTCVKLMEEWWQEFCTYAKRDQTPLTYVLWKNGFSKEDVLVLCEMDKYDPWDETPYWKYEKRHKKERFKVKN